MSSVYFTFTAHACSHISGPQLPNMVDSYCTAGQGKIMLTGQELAIDSLSNNIGLFSDSDLDGEIQKKRKLCKLHFQ